ncbi:MAG TPA: hypothetical protein VI233_09910 [Puia sp.]
MKQRILIALILISHLPAFAQSILDRTVTIEARQQPLLKVLEQISNKGGFYFSYNSAILNKDSLVSLPAQNRTIRATLDLIFQNRLQYQENRNYIILSPTPPPTPRSPAPIENRKFTINGVILDESTGESISQASIYDQQRLIATLSKDDGSFTVRLKNVDGPITLTISKEFYDDTTLRLQPGISRKLSIVLSPATFAHRNVTISPNDYASDSIKIEWQADSGVIKTIVKKDLIQVEMTGLGRLLLSSRLKIQTLNLQRFFTQRPVQLSLLPGLSTNGKLNSQVTNKLSVNVIGGYEAGLKGVELAGAFNIDKKEMHGYQAAGAVNIVGGPVQGVQMAGALNNSLDTVSGAQFAGAYNRARYLNGAQFAGAYNYARSVNGVQISGALNHTRHLRGLQVGLINIADTSDGVSLGLINIVRHKGFYELSYFADEVSPLNLAFRSGNYKLYTIFLAGINPTENQRMYYYGFGLGHSFYLNQKLRLNLEGSSEHLAPGDWENFKYSAFLNRLNLDLHWRINKYLSFSGGPSVAIYVNDKNFYIHGQLYHPLPNGYSSFSFSGNPDISGWIGWRASINFL